MTNLSEQQIDTLTARLHGRWLFVVEAIRRHLHQSDDPAERALAIHCDSDDGPALDALEGLGIAQMRHECEELRDIDAALKRIAAGSYGVCAQCGNDIPVDRMLAQPVARLCLHCQQESEQRHVAWSPS